MSLPPLARLLVSFALACGLVAQDGGRRVCQIGTIDAADAPRLDGILTDDCWRDAPEIGELVMVEPWVGRKPDSRTVIKLLHDRSNLYVSIWCEQDPESVRDSQRVRDARLDPDDRVELMFDSFDNRRTAYFFQISPGGSIGDALVSANGTRFNKPWDALWWGEARRTDDGWAAELEIPFRSIPRLKGARSWGFNCKRYVRDRNEEYQWDNPSQSVPFFRISEFGRIDGFGEIDGGIGLEFVPYITANFQRDRLGTGVDGDDWDFDPDAGGEIYYRVSPSITLATTVLTDFAQTENDGRQINLNRFPLFFPEKRDFFLDGESYYTFGSQFAGGTRFLPYFTRRIGLDSGTPVPILWGMKLQGEAGPFELGLINVQVDGSAATNEENLAVGRVKYALGDQSYIGIVGTNGDPTSGGTNSVFGVDFYHRFPEFVGDMDLQVNIDALVSTGDAGDDEGESFGIDLAAQGQEWEVQMGTRWVSDDFRPALGFVSRRGIRQSQASVSYRPRVAEGSAIRRYLFAIELSRAERWDGEPQQVEFELDDLGVEFQNGDRLVAFATRRFDRVFNEFQLFQRDGEQPRGTVRAGDYWNTRSGVSYRANEGRDVSGRVSLSTGDFFGGSSDSVSVSADWRTSPLLQVGGEFRTARIDLEQDGAFTTEIASATLDLFFDSTLSLRNLLQYDNESNAIGWQSRLRWIYEPGCDFFLVFGSNWQRTVDESIVPTQQAVNFKIAHTIRF
ncbi:MAG: carbohydrate binding family 9 domain-containing protein [Planctomycetota bacterium]